MVEKKALGRGLYALFKSTQEAQKKEDLVMGVQRPKEDIHTFEIAVGKLKDAKDQIDIANKDGINTTEAQDLYAKAEAPLKNKDYKAAIAYAEESRHAIEVARTQLFKSTVPSLLQPPPTPPQQLEQPPLPQAQPQPEQPPLPQELLQTSPPSLQLPMPQEPPQTSPPSSQPPQEQPQLHVLEPVDEPVAADPVPDIPVLEPLDDTELDELLEESPETSQVVSTPEPTETRDPEVEAMTAETTKLIDELELKRIDTSQIKILLSQAEISYEKGNTKDWKDITNEALAFAKFVKKVELEREI